MNPSDTSPPTATPARAADQATQQPSQSEAVLFVATIPVRWRDLDAFNHVNNSNYLTYLEEARLQWLSSVPGPWYSKHSAPVMAASELNYRRPIEWPAQLHVQLFCNRIGNSSMTVGHRIVDAKDPNVLYSDGQVVVVWMDTTTGKSVRLPQAIRDAAKVV